MKKKIIQILMVMIFCSSLYSVSYYSNNNTLNNQNDISIGAFNEEKDYSLEISETETYIVGQEQFNEPNITEENEVKEEIEEMEDTEELKILSEPLIFPDSYFNPTTEEYREEEFWDDCELIALVCVAEAEGESEYGKRLVIDSILNRMDSPYFPDNIHDVIFQTNPQQYACVWDGRINRVEYDEYIAKLVLEEMNNRTNNEVIYFKTKGYFNYGTPLLNEGSHYFSKR